MDSTFHKKRVSIIIPTYNRAAFISNAIQSVINQGCNNIEIIIIDDGSTDNTCSVVNSLKKEYPQIFYYHNECPKGPSGARNTGIIKSSGEYIAFLDSDDIWLDGHLKKGLEIFNKIPEIDVLFGNFSVVDFNNGKYLYNFFDDKKILHTLKSTQISPGIKVIHDNLFAALVRENFFHLGSAICRESSIKGILFDESIMFSEDRDFAIRLYKEANAKFAFTEDPVFIRYIHTANLYHTGSSNSWRKVNEAHLYLFRKYLGVYNLSNNEKRILTKLIVRKLMTFSYYYSKKKEFKDAISCILKGFKYSFSLINIRKV
jgi:glycosyltransferase involved in cell wall biosynthesis